MSQGENEVQAELQKHGGDELLIKVWKLIRQIWKSKKNTRGMESIDDMSNL